MSERGKWLHHLALAGLVIAIAFPLYWGLISSLRPETQLFEAPRLFPERLTLDHYRALLTERDFLRPVLNSLIVAASTTVYCLVAGVLCAWGIVRWRFRGRTLVLGGILAVGMFPQASIVAPLYLLLRSAGLIDTYPGLVISYTTITLPLTVWLLVAYFRRLPWDLEAAAMIDGASRWRALVQVMLPLALPGIATTATLTLIYCWNEFLFALSFTVSPERQTVPVAIALFRGRYQVPWGEILAAANLATLPVVLLVLLFQRRIVEGLTGGALRQ